MSPEVLLTWENLRIRRLIRCLITHIVMVHAEDEDKAEDSGPPGLETDESFSNEDEAEPSRSYTDVEPSYEEVEHWPDSSELEADEA